MTHHTISDLRDRHRWLEQRLRQELRRPAADNLLVQTLKRRKLRVKDELHRAKAGSPPASAAGMSPA